uniref:NLR family member X1 n=1 Tax=Oryzias melastigma TaxID=30732 RepID=A0A3B3DKL9_ORYME
MIGAHRRLCQLLTVWRRGPNTSLSIRTVSSASSAPDPLDIHKKKLFLWFSHLPKEEKQFGGSFRPETMHVDPLILERREEERSGLLNSPFQSSSPSSPPMTVEQLFHHTDAWTPDLGMNVLLYGAVGSGKDTVVRKLVLDWCCGTTLTQFKLLLPFSCKDLSQLSKAASLREIVGRKYLHLRNHPLLSGNEDQAKEVLFLFNGMEKMHLDFRIGSTELCSDPGEALPAAGVVVNLLRKYLLPEASILVTTRLSALDRIPSKYVSRYAQICGFSDPDHQRAYFSSRLLQQTGMNASNREAEVLVEQLYLNIQKKGQLAAACFLPSYCWLACATLHFLHFTSTQAPVCTLTGIYTSFLTLNFGGEVLDSKTGKSVLSQEQHISLMLYVVRTLGKLAFDGVTYKRRIFSERELEQWIGGKTKTDEELRLLAIFQTDVLNFFLEPCLENDKHLSELGEDDDRWYVFAVPAMQEYLAALYVVLGENKSALELLSKEFSAAIGQASDDVNALFNILSKFIPLRIFAVFNLLKLFPKFFEKISRHNKGKIAWTMTAAMFRLEDSNNDDVLEQVEQNLLGSHGPAPQKYSKGRPFELYPIFMGGLLHYGNRVLLQQLGCNIQSSTVAQITRTLRKYLVKELSKPLPPDEQMDLLVLLYEIQNPRLTAEVLSSIRSICLASVCMTSLKCFILSSVLSCTNTSYCLDKLDLSSCLLNHGLLQMLWPALKRVRQLNLQFNSLGPDSSILLRDLLIEPKASVSSLQLCGNPLQGSGCSSLLEALPENQTLQHLSLVHTSLGDHGAQLLATRLQQLSGLQELNVAYNNIGDEAAVALVEACRDHLNIHTVHLYLNSLSDAGKKSLCVRGENKKKKGQRVRVLASVTEGSDISEEWHPILSMIQENASTWDSKHVKDQLEVFLRDLEWGRQQQPSFWKRLHFRKVERGVRKIMQMVEEDTASKGNTNSSFLDSCLPEGFTSTSSRRLAVELAVPNLTVR